MKSQRTSFSRMLQNAAEDFRQATGKDDLWLRLHRQLSGFAISGIQYGTEAMGQVRYDHTLVAFDSFNPDYLQTKLREGLLEHDEFVRAGMIETAPILWDDASIVAARMVGLSPEAKLSLDIDWAFGITTGVTLPMRFADGLGVSAMGCHAAGIPWAEFDRLWREHGGTITGIASAFDTALRRDHVGELFPLSAQERECLLWLAAGLQQKQIADRLCLTDKQVGKRFATARTKLNAVTTTQAMATALIFGLIDP